MYSIEQYTAMYKLIQFLQFSQFLPSWNTVTSNTAAFAVILIAQFATASAVIGARCRIVWCRRAVVMMVMVM